MPPRRLSSRRRFAEYLSKRRSDRAYSSRSHGERAPDRNRRHRSFPDLFRAFWRLLRGRRSLVLAALGTLSVATLLGMAIPAATKFAIDYVITDHPGPSGIPPGVRELLALPEDRVALLWRLGLAMVSTSLLAVAIGTWGRFQMTRLNKQMQIHLRALAFARAVRLPLHRIYSYKSGGMASLLRDDASQAGDMVFSMIYNPWRAVVQLLAGLCALAFVDWRMLAGGLALLPAVYLSHKTWIARIRPVYRDIKLQRQGIDAGTTEAFGGMRVVRGFGQHRTESARFSRGQNLMARLEMLVWGWSRLVEVAWAVLIPLASAGVLVYGGSMVIRGRLTIGDVMMFSTYLLMLLGPLETLTSTATNIQTNLAGLDRVLDLLDEPTEFQETAPAAAPKPEVDRRSARGAIELRDVSYTYPRTEPVGGKPGADTTPPKAPEPVVRAVSLRVEAGQTVALVGASGAGKTTLCNLIARFFDPTQGVITLDGVDLRDVDVHSYRRLLGIVEQDVFLFDGTVAENIAYGRKDAPRSDIEQAARAANAHEFITKLDQGYETLIGERGVRLSGGQKQRVAIARALPVDPVILILDEATSNLDAESESLIQSSLSRLMKGRTCFVIAHRLSTVRHADAIVVMDHGQVREIGTHETLLGAGGRYAELLRTQIEAHLIPGALPPGSPVASR